MPAPDGTLLCLFSNDKCLIIDDFAPKLQNVYAIKELWPTLSTYSMDSQLDAAYYCPEHTSVAFFKHDECAVFNYSSKKWIQGKIKDYFNASASNLPAGDSDAFYSDLTAASTGVAHEYYALYKGTKFVNGKIAGQDPFTGKIQLNNEYGDIVKDGWQLTNTQTLVASTLVAELSTYGPSGDQKLERALIVHDTKDGKYKFTFDQRNVPGFTGVTGAMHLKTLYSEYDDNAYPIQAATRADPVSYENPKPTPLPAPTPIPIPHPIPLPPGPVLPNPLCAELGNIMKTICSLTVLMHKAIDACYPQSSWPTQPYPDGCSSSGTKRPCGCHGQSGGNPVIVGPGPVRPQGK